ncbi:hypothetical protein [Paenibacillus sp. OAS669]|uniref:hypothetical protein n=1 Tax=Paenibacillus sp. OAS669 TaxID=2663821 RepID=UPI00178A0B3B|nr:hypothetical protein [Paenibacillus sp. OAS669]MBE1447328.1 hypothetical protein [Paenibacillus sp. OAS669]
MYSTSLKEEQDWAQSMRQAEESNEIHEVGRFQELKRMIPDLTGWIRVQDTLIGYLIVQAQDNPGAGRLAVHAKLVKLN